tara:strand:- start:4011 stop:5405 length:1395 start_codon:yes stop_codon:yes gene_type:complete
MAIEGFGESLLTEKRKRDQREARNIRRRQDRNALLGLAGTVGISLYRQGLEKKQQDFFNSEQAYKLKLADRNANRVVTRAEKDRDAYENQGVDAFSYFEKSELAEARDALSGNEDFFKGQDRVRLQTYIDQGAYDPYLREKIKDRVDSRVAAHNDLLEFGDRYRLSGDIDEAVKKSYKGPTSAAEGLFRFLRKRDVDQENINAMRSTRLGTLILPAEGKKQSEVDILEQAFKDTGSFEAATELAKLPAYNFSERRTIDFEGKYDSESGKYRITRREKTFDARTGQQTGATITGEDSVNLNNPDEIDRASRDLLLKRFDPRGHAKDVLSLEGRNIFLSTLNKKYAAGDLKTVESVEYATSLLSDLIKGESSQLDDGEPLFQSKEGGYLKDPKARLSELQQAFVGSAAFTNDFGTYITILKDPNSTTTNKDAARRELQSLLDTLIGIGTTELGGSTDYLDTLEQGL